MIIFFNIGQQRSPSVHFKRLLREFNLNVQVKVGHIYHHWATNKVNIIVATGGPSSLLAAFFVKTIY